MFMPRFIERAAFALALSSAALFAHAQDYPSKPVRLVTAEPGGGHDLAARLIAQGLTAELGQQFIVDNRAGAIIAGEYVSRAPPDGYTLMIYGSSLWLSPFMRDKVPYDVLRDFAPIGLEVNAPILVVVHPSLPVKTVKELIALAKARPGQLDYATGQTGASTHLASELFKVMARVDMLRVPYRGNGPAVNALIAGQVQLMFPTAGSIAPHLKSGRVRALAVTSAKKSPLFPDLPAAASAGLAGYECDSIIGAFAPAKVPPAIISRLSKEMSIAVNKPELKQRFASSGVETVGSSPEVLAAMVKSEMTRLGKLIRDNRLREEFGQK
jgi:tripartite-type tricarboxylate transporter receptor subunit TctC